MPAVAATPETVRARTHRVAGNRRPRATATGTSAANCGTISQSLAVPSQPAAFGEPENGSARAKNSTSSTFAAMPVAPLTSAAVRPRAVVRRNGAVVVVPMPGSVGPPPSRRHGTMSRPRPGFSGPAGDPAQPGVTRPDDRRRPVDHLKLGDDVGDVVAHGLARQR